MANIYTQIQRKLNQRLYLYDEHFTKALSAEDFEIADALQVVRRPFDCFTYTDDESHERYSFDGHTKDGRILRVVLFLTRGRIKFKTAYEIFK